MLVALVFATCSVWSSVARSSVRARWLISTFVSDSSRLPEAAWM